MYYYFHPKNENKQAGLSDVQDETLSIVKRRSRNAYAKRNSVYCVIFISQEQCFTDLTMKEGQ